MTWQNTITYEQPINELVRTCLRLEYLFEKIKFLNEQSSAWTNNEYLHSMLEIVTISEKTELKSSLCKELKRYYGLISNLSQMAEVDHQQLDTILAKLSSCFNALNEQKGKFALSLKENEFLKAIRLQLSNIGGACNVNTPILNFWLHLSDETQKAHLNEWMKELRLLQDIIVLLLQLIRESASPQLKTAENGFYEVNLNAKQSLQLLRVEVPVAAELFPEISSGRHRACIRFLKPNFCQRASKIDNDIEFKMTICVL